MRPLPYGKVCDNCRNRVPSPHPMVVVAPPRRGTRREVELKEAPAIGTAED